MKRYPAAFLCLFFFAMLAYGFPDSPSPWFDEGVNLGIAKAWAERGVYSLEVGPDSFVGERSLLITTNYPLLAPLALVFRLFGAGLPQAKLVMFAFLAAFLLLAYQFVKKNYGEFSALGSVALLVTFLPLYGNGKSGLGEIPGLVYLLGGLLLLEKKKPWQLLLAGLLLGLAAATKSLYIIIIPCLVAAELYASWKERPLPWRRWLMMSLGLTLPLLLWVYSLLPRPFSVSTLQETFRLYANPYQAEHTVSRNFLRFVTETTPAHFLMLFLAAGVFFVTRRPRQYTRSEIIISLFIILNLLFYVRTVGWYRYFFPAHVLLFLLFPAALMAMGKQWQPLRGQLMAAALLMVLVTVQTGHLVRNFRSSLYVNPTPRQFASLVHSKVPREADIVVVGFPEMAFLLNRDAVSQYVQTSPYLLAGQNPFVSKNFPPYVIAGVWEQTPLLAKEVETRQKYEIIASLGPYYLYQETVEE